MDKEQLYQAIRQRRSIRKYAEPPLDEKTMAVIDAEIASLKPLYPGIRTRMEKIGTGATKGMFKVAAPHYLAIYSENKPGYAANAGFLLQQMDLSFSSMGIGSCWQGGSKPAKKKAADDGLEYVIMLSFGRPAEDLHRTETSQFKRKPLAEITDANGMDELLEPVRLAPSGINNQSWFYHAAEDGIDAYSAKSMLTDEMNQINVGIGLCHLWLSAAHLGRVAEFRMDPEREAGAPKGYRYITTASLK